MDPTTAALLGAAIGGGASILAGTIGPLVRDAIERRARNKRENRQDILRELLATIEAASALHRRRLTGPRDAAFLATHASAAAAATRLSILVSRRDHHAVNRMLSFAIDTISNGDNSKVVEVSFQALAGTLEQWYRGEVRGDRIGDEYGRTLSDLIDAAKAKR